MDLLAWFVFIVGLSNILLAPTFIGKEQKKTTLEAMLSFIIGCVIALFAGIYLFID